MKILFFLRLIYLTFPHSIQMMSMIRSIHIVFLILYALNAIICHNVTEDRQGEIDGDYRRLEKKNWYDQESDRLANALAKRWQEMNKLLLCSEHPVCVVRFYKKYRIGKKNVRMNLVQSLTLILHQIKDISTKLYEIQR